MMPVPRVISPASAATRASTGQGLHVLKGRGQVVLARADVMKARLTRQPHHLQQLDEALAEVFPDGVLHRQRHPEAHGEPVTS